MKTLYVSDLDGTLLRSDERLSAFTCQTINELTGRGMLFSYATARSLVTSRKVTQGLNAPIPLIVYNGAFVMDNRSGERLLGNFFNAQVSEIFEALRQSGVFPIVYAFIDGVEKFSFVETACNRGTAAFLQTRLGDVRWNAVTSFQELTRGECFYFTCIDEPEKLYPLYERFRTVCHCVCQRELYSGDLWLEIMPRKATKANASLQLKKRLGCDKMVAFGDGHNDLDLFEVADECYAVENAVPELKRAATGVIESNDRDGVAKWLLQRFKKEEEC